MTERLTEEELDRRLAETDVDDGHAEDLGYPVATETGLVEELRHDAGTNRLAANTGVGLLHSEATALAIADLEDRAAQRIDFLEGENGRYREALTKIASEACLGGYHFDRAANRERCGRCEPCIARHSLQQNNDEKGV